MVTPKSNIPTFDVTVQKADPLSEWTVPQAIELLRSGYALPHVARRTHHDPVRLAQLARAKRIEVRQR